ncbi:hypothetical protein ABT330_09345 [Streptomyces sp. NPDC000658]|uniref:hypothetical protein n=1 Tax=Streptomyces sp. NPDC000658 TaxID=3154266 RepID=UPI0033246E6F
MQDPDALDVLDALDAGADVALCAVEVEGPVEKELIYSGSVSRGASNAPARWFATASNRALRHLLKQGEIVKVDPAYDRPGHETEFARTPTDRCARRVAEAPAAERQLVLTNVVGEGPGVHREDLQREAARFFGWTRLGADIRDALTGDIDALMSAGDLIESDGGLMPAAGA